MRRIVCTPSPRSRSPSPGRSPTSLYISGTPRCYHIPSVSFIQVCTRKTYKSCMYWFQPSPVVMKASMTIDEPSE
jgi:hypothetical protein